MRRSFLIVLLAIACFAAASASPVSAQTSGGKMRIVGHATIEKVPDIVSVTVGVTKRAATPTAAMDQNSTAARKIVDFSKKFGIADQDIRTASVNLSQAYKNVREPDGTTRQEPDGYIATNNVRVRLKDLSRVGDYLRQVLDQGATNIGAVQFSLSDPEASADEAGAKAVEDAVRRARRLAEAAHVKLGSILEIVEQSRGDFRPVAGAADFAAQRAAPVPVEAGTLNITAEVEITWALE